MNYGKIEDTLREQYARTGRMPEALEKKPQLHWYLDSIMHGFIQMSDRRGFTQAILPLSISDIRSYIELAHWEGDSEFFMRCVFELDNEYLKISAQKAKMKADVAKKAKPKK